MTIETDLQASIYEEQVAESKYRRRARKADLVTAKLYRHIADQEHHHAQEFQSRLEKVRARK